MSLLPREHSQFAEERFWDSFFKKRGDKSFDWYGEYTQLSGVIHKYIKPADSVLMVGCGNSTLSEDLYDLSYRDIHNIDISDQVVRRMSERNSQKRPSMPFTKMDATKMTFEDESFKSAIDKGTLDALLPEDSHAELAMTMLADVWRVLKYMGTHIIITLAQDHVIKRLIEFYSGKSCIVRIHKLPRALADENAFVMPVFAVVITKLKQMPNFTTVWESSLNEGTNTRYKSSDELLQTIKECQYYAMLQLKLSKGEALTDGKHAQVKLYSSADSEVARYTIYVVDKPSKCKDKFAVFIVPQGQENSWLYSSEEGRNELSSRVTYQRLLVVTLSRGQVYKDIDEVTAELSTMVMELAPPGTEEKKAPFLTTKEGIGIRNTLYQTDDALSGSLVVEDVNTESHTTLRQIYNKTSDKIIGSAKVVTKKTKHSVQRQVQHQELIDELERITAAFVCLARGNEADGEASLPNVLIVGLGCGTLPCFIEKFLTGLAVKSVTCLEADKQLIHIAREFYGLPNNVKVVQGAIEEMNSQDCQFDCIVWLNDNSQISQSAVSLLSDCGIVISTTPLKHEQLPHFNAASVGESLENSKRIYVLSRNPIDVKDKRLKKRLYKVKENLLKTQPKESALDQVDFAKMVHQLEKLEHS